VHLFGAARLQGTQNCDVGVCYYPCVFASCVHLFGAARLQGTQTVTLVYVIIRVYLHRVCMCECVTCV